jgi:hypothetical protein
MLLFSASTSSISNTTLPSRNEAFSSKVIFEWDEGLGWISYVTRQGRLMPLCWLPEHLRGSEFATHGTTVVMGGRSGSITILDFTNADRSDTLVAGNGVHVSH